MLFQLLNRMILGNIFIETINIHYNLWHQILELFQY